MTKSYPGTYFNPNVAFSNSFVSLSAYGKFAQLFNNLAGNGSFVFSVSTNLNSNVAETNGGWIAVQQGSFNGFAQNCYVINGTSLAPITSSAPPNSCSGEFNSWVVCYSGAKQYAAQLVYLTNSAFTSLSSECNNNVAYDNAWVEVVGGNRPLFAKLIYNAGSLVGTVASLTGVPVDAKERSSWTILQNGPMPLFGQYVIFA